MSTPSHNDIPEWLEALRKRSEFIVPEGYFQALAENIQTALEVTGAGLPFAKEDEFVVPEGSQVKLREEILQNTVGSSDKMSVPEGYFDKLADDIMARVDEPTAETPVVSINQSRRLWASVAVAASLIAAVFIISPTDVKCESFACLLEQTDFGYEDIEYLTTEDLEILLTEGEDEIDETDDELIDYLLDEDLDIDDLLEEY